ncbi:MAG: TonB-dependent receptor [Pseudomonadota bacterium]
MKQTQCNKSILATLICSLSVPLSAQEVDENLPKNDINENEKKEETITVKGQRVETEEGELGRGVSELSGEELMQKMGSTLGETLGSEVGIHNASFGSSVGLPIIRGLGGARVQLLQNSLATWDGSSLSPDHATSLEAMNAETIRILRGPGTLKYGSGAGGGVIDVIDKRLPEERLSSDFQLRFDQRNIIENDRNTSHLQMAYDMQPVIVYLDGFHREQEDESIPEFAIDPLAAFEQYGVLVDENTRGFVDNTDAKAAGGNAGLSWVEDDFFVGLAFNQIDNNYGIPSGSHPEAGHVHDAVVNGEEGIRIDLYQNRYDFKTGVNLSQAWLETATFRYAKTDYQHDEFELGTAGTHFDNRAEELRFEMTHAWRFLSGEIGVQGVDRQFSALGEEAFIPENDLETIGAYLIETINLNEFWTTELGGRLEEQKITNIASRISPDLRDEIFTSDITHRQSSYSAALTRKVFDNHLIGVAWSEAMRAPAIQELLSFGPHLATRTYDVGDSQLTQEKLRHIELSVDSQWNNHQWEWNWFYTDAENYIYQQNQGFLYDLERRGFFPQCVRVESCLPVMQYRQEDATLRGYEFAWQFPEFIVWDVQHTFNLFSDYVRGQFTSSEDIPRMPPRRYGLRWQMDREAWSGSIQYIKADEQKYPGLNETTTEGYDLLNAELSWVWRNDKNTETLVYLVTKNLLDEEIRQAVSHLRNFAPEPGRTVQIGLRVDYE